VLGDAGFSDVTVETVPAPLKRASAEECLRFEMESFGALHHMLSRLNADDREAAWAEIADALREFEDPGGSTGPCEMLVICGRK
jgi:hypothetical protein